MDLEAFKIKIFDSYLKDTGSTYEGFLDEKKLKGASEQDIMNAKLQIIDEAIEIVGKDELFQNYLSEQDFALFKEQGF